MTRRIALIILTYVAGIALVAYVLIPGSGQIEHLRDWNAYLILVLFLAFVGLLLGRAKWPQPTQNIFTVFLLILLVYGFSGLREPFEFKVLQNEATLSMTALSLHLNRTTEVPARAHQIGRKFVLRARAKINSDSGITSSHHLWPLLNREILDVALLCLRIRSIVATKPGTNLRANSVNLFWRGP